jgi:hypothetical protein
LEADSQRDTRRPTYNHEHRTILRHYAHLMNPSVRSIHIRSDILNIHRVAKISTFSFRLIVQNADIVAIFVRTEKKKEKKTCGRKNPRCLANLGRTFSTSEDLANQTEQNLPQRTQGTVAVLTRESSVQFCFPPQIRPQLPSPRNLLQKTDTTFAGNSLQRAMIDRQCRNEFLASDHDTLECACAVGSFAL